MATIRWSLRKDPWEFRVLSQGPVVKNFFWVPKIDPTIMAPISMIHWDPMGMGMWHMYELEAYVYVYWHDAYILCHLNNFSQVR